MSTKPYPDMWQLFLTCTLIIAALTLDHLYLRPPAPQIAIVDTQSLLQTEIDRLTQAALRDEIPPQEIKTRTQAFGERLTHSLKAYADQGWIILPKQTVLGIPPGTPDLTEWLRQDLQPNPTAQVSQASNQR